MAKDLQDLDAALNERRSSSRPAYIDTKFGHLVPLIARYAYRTSDQCPPDKRADWSMTALHEWLAEHHGFDAAITTLRNYIRARRTELIRDGKTKATDPGRGRRSRRKTR